MKNINSPSSKIYLNIQNKNFPAILENKDYEGLINNDIMEFHKGFPGYKETPLYELKYLAESLKVKTIFIKDESSRFGLNSFKSLGSSYAIAKILEKSSNKDSIMFCSGTDGNYGKALAWAAKMFKKPSTIFVPSYMTEKRKLSILSEDANLIVSQGNYDTAVREAFDQSKKNGWTYVQDSSFEGYTEIPMYIMTGYLTLIMEVEKIVDNNFDIVVLQSGVGTYPASIMYYLIKQRTKMGLPVPKFIIVEPLTSDCFLESAKTGSLCVSKDNGTTIMIGLNCKTPSLISLPIITQGADLFISIDDSYTIKAMKKLYFPLKTDPQIISGESGAAGLAGLLALLEEDQFKEIRKEIDLGESSRILLISTEGASDFENFEKLVKKSST